ncbi:uncharacterized protein [Aquarana catesbeiana]|uniref:uncharacterized protein n=1 Tax=Aquarana catesbeiana TaxID=8400 RepID=UPI003CCA2404
MATIAATSSLCYFPFVFNHRTYNTCTTDGGTTFHWCSQTYNFETDLKWSLCSNSSQVCIEELRKLEGEAVHGNNEVWCCKGLESKTETAAENDRVGLLEELCKFQVCIDTNTILWPVLPSNSTLCSITTEIASTTDSTPPPTTSTQPMTSTTLPPSTTSVQITTPLTISTPPTTSVQSVTSTTLPPSTMAVQNTIPTSTSPPPTTSVQSVTSTTLPPSTTSVQITTPLTISTPPTMSVQSVTSTTLPPSTTSVQITTPLTISTPPTMSVQSVTSTTLPPSTTSVQITTPLTISTPPTMSVQSVASTALPSSTTSVQITTPLTTSPPPTTSVQSVTSITLPPSTMVVQNTTQTTTYPPPTTSVQSVTSTTLPPSTTSVQITTPLTTSTLPTSVQSVTSTTLPPSTMAVQNTTQTTTYPPPTTSVQSVASTTLPPSTMVVQNTTPTSTSPPPTTSVQSVASTALPSSTTSVQITTPLTTSPPPTTSVQSVTSITLPPSTMAVQNTTQTTTYPPPTTSVQSVTSTTLSPSTTSVQITTPLTTSPPFTTSVQSVTSTTLPPSTMTLQNTTPITTSPPPTTRVQSVTSTSLPPSMTAVQITTPLTTSPPPTTSVQSVTSTTLPPSTTAVQITPLTTSPQLTASIQSVTSTSLPPSTTSVQITIPLTSPSTMGVTSVTTSVSTTATPTTAIFSTGQQSTISQLSSGFPLPGSSIMPSTSSAPGFSSSTSTYAINMANLQLWMNQASLNQLNSGGVDVIESLWNYTTSSSVGFQQTEIPLALYLLGNITKNAQLANLKFNVTTVEKVLLVTDQLVTDISLEPSVSLEENLGPQLLRCLENVFSVMSVTYQALSKSYKNFEFSGTVSPCGDLEENKILHLNSSASVSLQNIDNNFPSGCYMNLLSMTYSPKNCNITGLCDNNTMDAGYFLASDIHIYVMMINDSSYHMANINTTFTCENRTCDQTAVCVFWDFLSNKWSSQGCVTQVSNGSVYCMCSHLTSFAVLMSNSIQENTADSTIQDYITKIGLFISIVSLVVCILIQVILLKHSVKMAALYRHVVIIHMAVFLLIGMVSFLAPDFITHPVQDQLCMAFTFCSHFSFMGFFSWTLIQGLYLASRLLFVFHHVTKTELVSVSVVLGYICPVAIAVGTFLAYFPNNYMKSSDCTLDIESGASLAFIIPVMVTLFINFLVLIVVIRKLLRPSISEGKSEDEEVLKKMAKAVIFCVPQFGLTWAIGIPLFSMPAAQKSTVLQYMFVILNPLQGFFLLLFGCLLDKKVMDLVRKHLWKNSSPRSLATSVISTT